MTRKSQIRQIVEKGWGEERQNFDKNNKGKENRVNLPKYNGYKASVFK